MKSIAALQRQEQPEWMSKKLKAVAKPPAFLELTPVVDAPSGLEGAPAATKGAPSKKETIASIKVVATDERVAYRPPVSLEEKGKPTWMARKLQPVGKTQALPVLSTKSDAITSQPETTFDETKDPPAFIVLAKKDQRVVQESVASLDEGRKPAWMTKKLKPVVKTAVATADTTEVEVTAFKSEAISTETKDSPTPIVLATNDEKVPLLVAHQIRAKVGTETRKPDLVAKSVTTVASRASPIGANLYREFLQRMSRKKPLQASTEASAKHSTGSIDID
jgi:hypothetical protein